MTQFNKLFIECISEWSKKAEQCDNNECLEDCKKGLLESLDKIFPYSKDIEFEVDKVKELYDLVPGDKKEFLVMKNAIHAKIPLESWEQVVAWLDKTYL